MTESRLPDLGTVGAVDTVGVEERVARFCTRSIKSESKVSGLKLVLSMIDLTTLEGADTPGKVRQLCMKAQHLNDRMPGLPTVAAVPVPARWASASACCRSCRSPWWARTATVFAG